MSPGQLGDLALSMSGTAGLHTSPNPSIQGPLLPCSFMSQEHPHPGPASTRDSSERTCILKPHRLAGRYLGHFHKVLTMSSPRGKLLLSFENKIEEPAGGHNPPRVQVGLPRAHRVGASTRQCSPEWPAPWTELPGLHVPPLGPFPGTSYFVRELILQTFAAGPASPLAAGLSTCT